MKVYFHLNIEGFSNAYLIVNPAVKEALIIDPGKITTKMIDQIEQNKYALTAVFITHNHKSHTRGLTTLQKIYAPKIYAADYEVAKTETSVLRGDGIIKAAGLNVSYMSLPGHTGDVLFAGQAGPTNSSYAKKTLIANIASKILSQQENTVILPGHGPPSSVGAERQFNLDM